jgi:hypothetical protein
MNRNENYSITKVCDCSWRDWKCYRRHLYESSGKIYGS